MLTVVDLHTLSLLICHCEVRRANSYKFELELLTHDRLIKVDDATFAIDQYGLLETSGLTHCDTAFQYKQDLSVLGLGRLDDHPVLQVLVLHLDDKFVDELLLATFEQL